MGHKVTPKPTDEADALESGVSGAARHDILDQHRAMGTPFESAHRKIARAGHHFAELQREISAWANPPYELFTEAHPLKAEHVVHKLRLASPLPERLSEIAGDIIGNLRQALDHAIFAVAVAAGRQNAKNSYFPFSGTEDRFESTLRGRCKDVPPEIYPLLRSFKPYKGGNEILFGLNQLANRDKHALLIPVGVVTFEAGVDIRGSGFFSLPRPLKWDRAKNEMELHTLGPGAQFDANYIFTFEVVFADFEMLEDEHVLAVLDAFGRAVSITVSAVEAECARLGICQNAT